MALSRSRNLQALLACALLLTLAVPTPAISSSRVFAGTWGAADSRLGHVYRYETGTAWTRLSPTLGLGDAVWDLEWHEGELWAVTHEGAAASSAPLVDRATTPHGSNGRVFRFDGVGWEDHSPSGGFGSAATTVSSMAGTLYVTVDRDGLYRWEGGSDWTLLGDFIMGAQALVSNSHDGDQDVLYLGQDNTDEFWVHDPSGVMPCGDWESDPRSLRTDCQEPVGDSVCSADCWPGSCIHGLAEFDDGAGPLVYGGAWHRRMYRWEPVTRLFDRIPDVPALPPNGEEQHVQGLASWRGRLWVGLSDGHLVSGADPLAADYAAERAFGPEWPISDLYVAASDDLLWIGFGAVPWRWARNDGSSRIWTFDGVDTVERGLPGELGDGVLVLLAVEPEILCGAGPEQVVECEGGLTAIQLDGSATELPAALALEPSFEWSGGFVEGTAEGPAPVVHFDGPGEYLVVLTVTAGSASATCETLVRIVDEAPPVLTAGQACLWPPNHRYRCFGVADLTGDGRSVALDACEGEVAVTIVEAWSSQPEDETGAGDGHTRDDLLFDGERICVRGERQGADGQGRDYTVVLESSDESGNVARVEVILHVPHDQRPEDRCPPRPVDPGLRPVDPLPLDPGSLLEGSYPPAVREPRR